MNTQFRGFPDHGQRLVYVRPIAVKDLPDELREQVPGASVVYSVHAADGEQLALAADRNIAFHLAKAYDYAPVSVH